MRLRMNDRRERRFESLQEATGENTKRGVLDGVADYYLAMTGGTGAYPTGAIEELMQLAFDRGSVTAAEIAEVLDVSELPVDHERDWSVGRG